MIAATGSLSPTLATASIHASRKRSSRAKSFSPRAIRGLLTRTKVGWDGTKRRFCAASGDARLGQVPKSGVFEVVMHTVPQARAVIRFGVFEADVLAGELRKNGIK